MKNEFTLTFENNKVDLFLRGTYYGSGFAKDGLLVMDVQYVNNNDASFSYVASSSDRMNDVNLWHVRLSRIGQDRMSRPAKAGLVGNL